MPTISLDYIKDLIDTCKEGNLLITYYRDYDTVTERIKELFKYIDKNRPKDLNWVKLDVTNYTEVCARLAIYPPCTIWYKNNRSKYNFGSYTSGDDIVSTINFVDNHPVRISERRDDSVYYRIPVPQGEEDDEIDF